MLKTVLLGLALHGAVTFDAYTTRLGVAQYRFREANPTWRPFVRTNALYAYVQIAPLALELARWKWPRHGRLWEGLAAVAVGVHVGAGTWNLEAVNRYRNGLRGK